MPPPDSSAIDDAILAVLEGDAVLSAIVPDGVWIDEAPAQSRRFVIVSLVLGQDVATFGGRAWEERLYLIKAVVQALEPSAAIDAAARVNALLEDAPIAVPGYAYMTMHRIEPLQRTEVDEVNEKIRWQHRGGRYRVNMSLA